MKSVKVGGKTIPIRGGKNKFKDLKHTQLLYMTYVLSFPDGDQWIKQKQFSAHDLAFELNKMRAEYKNTYSGRSWMARTEALWRTGECWWKDEMGVETLILIESKKRKEKWGVSREGLTIEAGVTEERFLKGTIHES